MIPKPKNISLGSKLKLSTLGVCIIVVHSGVFKTKIMVEVDQQLITNQLQSWIKVYNEVIDMDDFIGKGLFVDEILLRIHELKKFMPKN